MVKLPALSLSLALLASTLPIISAIHVPAYPDNAEYDALRALIRRQDGEGEPIVHTDVTDGNTPAHGVQGFGSQLRSRIPLTCRELCKHPTDMYSACFYGGTFPPAQRDRGCELLCRQDWYDFTTACFTCIVENGGEIEGGGVAFIGKPTNDEDLLMDNAEYADAAMRNITELCEANFTAVATPVETFTATPTTTGPYTTAWSSGDTVIIDYWTGMTEYKTMYPVEFIYPSQHWSRHTSVPLNTGINTGTGIMRQIGGASSGDGNGNGSGDSSSPTNAAMGLVPLSVGTVSLSLLGVLAGVAVVYFH